MAQTVQFGKSKFVEEVGLLQEIVDKVKDVRGTASARKLAATHEALGVAVVLDGMPTLEQFGPLVRVDLGDDKSAPGMTLGHLAKWVKATEAWAEQVADEQVTLILKAKSPDATTLDALKEQYAKKKEYVEAMATMMSAMGIDISDVTIPVLRAGGGSSSGSTTRTVKTGNMRWYRIVNGEKLYQGDSQNKHSSMAFYHSKKAMGLDEKASTEEFNAWLAEQDGFTSVTLPWEVTGADGNKYGMEVIEQD